MPLANICYVVTIHHYSCSKLIVIPSSLFEISAQLSSVSFVPPWSCPLSSCPHICPALSRWNFCRNSASSKSSLVRAWRVRAWSKQGIFFWIPFVSTRICTPVIYSHCISISEKSSMALHSEKFISHRLVYVAIVESRSFQES